MPSQLSPLRVCTPAIASQPHLVLHFDVNKTLIASDKANNKDVEIVINEMLATNIKACWDETILKPISYESYIKGKLLPGDECDLKLRRNRNQLLHHFIDYLHSSDHPLYSEAVKIGDAARQVLQNAKGDVFPSFYRLIDELDKRELSYSIILRSFGEEVFDVADKIESFSSISFSQNGEMHQGSLCILEKEYESPQAIYKVFTEHGNLAIRDDWNSWMLGGKKPEYGKPIFINSEDTATLSMFLDDNIVLDDNPDYNIVGPKDSKTGIPIPASTLANSGQLVRVNTLNAILDENYFVKQIDTALEKR